MEDWISYNYFNHDLFVLKLFVILLPVDNASLSTGNVSLSVDNVSLPIY